MYYNKQGNQISALEFSRIPRDERVVARSELFSGNNEVVVSTVLLGLDHGNGIGNPIIFETMVFGGELDGEMDRYATQESANAGHLRMVKRVLDARNSEEKQPPKASANTINDVCVCGHDRGQHEYKKGQCIRNDRRYGDGSCNCTEFRLRSTKDGDS